jgi:hypothetical protein
MRVTALLDESGTHLSSTVMLVGLVVVPNIASINGRIREYAEQLLADGSVWDTSHKKEEFRARGFHFAHDNEDVRSEFISEMRSLDYRAHVAYSRLVTRVHPLVLQTNMFYCLVRNVLMRYRHRDLDFVFEQGDHDHLPARIVAQARQDILHETGTQTSLASVYIGTKKLDALAITDYVMGVCSRYIEQERPTAGMDFRRFQRITPSLAHVFNFDEVVHASHKRGVLF